MKKKQSLTSIELQKKVIRGILTIGALTLLIIFLFGNHGLYQLYILKKERNSIQEKINLLREEKIALEDEKTKLQTDNKHIEEIAREKYRMSKKGERVFKVIEKEEQN
ncbi:MAG: septum formation initiator family protein [Candidatus Neomarinimicrobiota bacterium]|nr:septum formation initiator family protein [Candidatus Neomarinimicrobiota bacterium]MEC9448189.1 septum formation initiator family protein [Candidatus Neomarinimicrobiota bacterium]